VKPQQRLFKLDCSSQPLWFSKYALEPTSLTITVSHFKNKNHTDKRKAVIQHSFDFQSKIMENLSRLAPSWGTCTSG